MSSYIRALKPILSYMVKRGRRGIRRKRGVRFLSIRSRMTPKAKRHRALTLSSNRSRSRSRSMSVGRSRSSSRSLSSLGISSASSGTGMEGDGVKLVKFTHGRPARSNAKYALKVRRSLTPINTHIVSDEGNIIVPNSGACAYQQVAFGRPVDIESIRATAIPVLNPSYTAVGAEVATGMVVPKYDGKFYVHSYENRFDFRNQAQQPCVLRLYECIARENVVSTTAFSTLDNILQNGFTRKNLQPSGCIPNTDVDGTLYMNPVWCHNFKILRVRKIHLNAGEMGHVTLTHGHPREINTMLLGDDPRYLAIRGYTRFIVMQLHGAVVRVVDPNNPSNLDYASAEVSWKMSTYYRWNAVPYQSELVTQAGFGPDAYGPANQKAYDPEDGDLAINNLL